VQKVDKYILNEDLSMLFSEASEMHDVEFASDADD
jgi:hypothetical protein